MIIRSCNIPRPFFIRACKPLSSILVLELVVYIIRIETYNLDISSTKYTISIGFIVEQPQWVSHYSPNQSSSPRAPFCSHKSKPLEQLTSQHSPHRSSSQTPHSPKPHNFSHSTKHIDMETQKPPSKQRKPSSN